MVILGLWLGIIGYGIAYAGMLKLGGAQCSLGDAFRGRCQPSTATRSTTAGSGVTLLATQQAVQQQQAQAVPTTPIPSPVVGLTP